MKSLIAVSLASTLAFSSVAFAGGPVVIEDVEVVVEESNSSFGILPIIIVGIALCAAICGSDDEEIVIDEDVDIPPPPLDDV